MLVYANYTDIFYHRSMDKDKLLDLDVWSAYSQKTIKKLDRSERTNIAQAHTSCRSRLIMCFDKL